MTGCSFRLLHDPARTWARLLVLLALACFAAVAFAQPVAREFVRVQEAEFRQSPHDPWRKVALPDTWTLTGLPGGGQGEYRFWLELTEVPTEPWALYGNRISTARTVSVNGTVVDQIVRPQRIFPGPASVRLTGRELRPGRNEVRIAVHYEHRGGLSTLLVGPARLAELELADTQWWEEDVPQHLNLAAGVFALLLLLIWWRQPGETSLGLFGLLGLAGSLRNYIYRSGAFSLTAHGANVMSFVLTSWTALLLIAYAHGLRHGRPPGWRGPWGAAMALIPLLGLLAPPEWVHPLRVTVYAVLGLGGAWALVGAIAAARPETAGGRLMLLALVALLVGAAFHDYAFQIAGWLPITHQIALLWAIPLALCGYSVALLTRLFDAMTQVDLLNRTLEDRVRQRTLALDAANQAKSRFLSTASHDLRQPLVSVALLWGLLREEAQGAGTGARTQDLLQQMGLAVSSMEALLKSLLDFSRLESLDRPPVLRAVDVRTLCESVLAAALPQAASSGVRLRLYLPRGRLAVRSDPLLLEQMLRNLVDNAVRYTDHGGVLLAARRRGGRVEISIYDTGRGIGGADRERIFEPFLQLDNPGRSSRQGWGLGLAIVRRGAALLAHDVQLRSVPGRGSCFRLALDATHLAPDAPVPAPVQELTRVSLRGRAVWLVEDEEGVRAALALRLTQWGAKVSSFEGAAALRGWLEEAQEWPDLVVCDERLPDGSGIDLMAMVRADAPVPVAAVLVTGDTSPEHLAAQRRSGVLVLHKPFGTEALWASIASALAATSVQADAAARDLDHRLGA